MKRAKKITLQKKKKMYRGTFDQLSESKYAKKKRLQQSGIFSAASPFGKGGQR
ncbi:MAG: hypothetical protein Kow0098_03260 [Ignavibacteriaceae bacterium]